MPRPIKEGLDYFPLDVNLDDKIYMVECELGLTGFALLIKLFIKIYKNGYYINWNEKIAKMFARQNNTEIDVVNKLLDVCINEEIVNKNLYQKYKILTSRGIQKRYMEAVKRRKEINLIKEYMLVEIVEKSINVNINWIDVNNNSINDDHNKHTKVEKSKVEKSKVEKSKVEKSKVEKSKEKKEYIEAVFLTQDEYKKLIEELGKPLTEELIKDLSLYIKSQGKEKKYKSHYATILAWHRKDIKEGKNRLDGNKPNKRLTESEEKQYSDLEEVYDENGNRIK